MNLKTKLRKLPDWIMSEGYTTPPRRWLSLLYMITRPLWIAWMLYLLIKILRSFEIEYWYIVRRIWSSWYLFSEALDIKIYKGY